MSFSLSSLLSPPLQNYSAVKLKHLLTLLLSSDARVTIWEEKQGWADERTKREQPFAWMALLSALSSRTCWGPASEPVFTSVSPSATCLPCTLLGPHNGVSPFLKWRTCPNRRVSRIATRLTDCRRVTED